MCGHPLHLSWNDGVFLNSLRIARWLCPACGYRTAFMPPFNPPNNLKTEDKGEK